MKAEGGQARERIAAEDRARADVYALLGNLLAGPPSAEVLSLLSKIETLPDEGVNTMTEAWNGLRTMAASAGSMDLAQEYHDLFIGLGRGEVVPYGSWYLTGYLMEKPLADLRERLAELGYARQDEVYEPEDHAAALCSVMGMIISENELSFQHGRDFFEEFLGSWLGRFFSQLNKAEAALFYRAVGRLGEAFMEVEKTYYSLPE